MMSVTHLGFLTVLYCSGLIAWALDIDHADTPRLIFSTIVAGLGAGAFLSVWLS